MGGLWRTDGVPCAAAGFETKAEAPKSCHGEWRSSEQRSGREVLEDIKQGWRSEKIINSPIPNSDNMSGTPFSPAIPVADNAMDIDSDPDSEQAARELVQAQEWVCIVNEAQERCREERKQKEEEARRVAEREAEEEVQWVARETAAREAEELLEMERQYQLQVSTGVLWNSTCTNFVAQKDLEASVMMPEPLLAPFTDKGKEVSTG